MEEKETKKVEGKEPEVKKAETGKVEANKTEQKKADTKKVDTKKTETKKAKTTSKKEGDKKSNSGVIVAIAIVALVVIALIVYCVLMMDSPKRAVEAMFTEAKMGTFEQSILESLGEDDEVTKEAIKAMFSNLSWKVIKEEKQDEENATVEVEVTNKDFKTIMGNFTNKILKSAINGESIDEAKTEQYLIEEMNNSEIENVTETQTIKVKKQDGKWQILKEENDIDDILLPGFNEGLENIK